MSTQREQDDDVMPDDSLALARVAIRVGSWMQVVLSGLGVFFLIVLFTFIEKRLDMPGHSEFFMYSTICTSTIMVISGIVGVLTTWKKGILLRGGRRTRRFALYKAVLEAGLFLYMAPFIATVCWWFLSAPGVSIWIKLAKCVMELPSVVFQFTWAAACVKYWHMLDEDAKEARINRGRVTESLLPGGDNGGSGSAAYGDVAHWTRMAEEKAPKSPRAKDRRAAGGFGPASHVVSQAPLDTTEDLAALLGVTVEPVALGEGAELPDGKLPLQAAEGFQPTHADDIPASLSSGSPAAHSGLLQAAIDPVATGDDSQEDSLNGGAATVADSATRGKFRAPRAGAAADVAAAFSGTSSSGLNNTKLRRDMDAAAFNPVDTASQGGGRRFGVSMDGGAADTMSDENETSVSISKLVGMLKARKATPSLGEAFAGRGSAASWMPGAGISGGLKNGSASRTSPQTKRGSGGTSQRWNPGTVPLSTHNFDGAASSDDEADDFRPPPRDSPSGKRPSLPGFGATGSTVLGTKVSNVLNRMRAAASSGTSGNPTGGPR